MEPEMDHDDQDGVPHHAASHRAMNNPVVLGKIGSTLLGSDLANLRRACSWWSVNLNPAFKQKHQMIQLDNDTKVKEFTKLLRGRPVPFSRYDLGHSVSVEGLDDFVRLCAKTATILWIDLNRKKETRMESIRKLIFIEAVQLKELTIAAYENYDDDDHDEEVLSPASPEPEPSNQDEGQGQDEARPEAEAEQHSDIVQQIPHLRRLRVCEPGTKYRRLITDLMQQATGLKQLIVDWEADDRNSDQQLLLVLTPLLLNVLDSEPMRINFSRLKSLSLSRVRAADHQILLQLATASQQRAGRSGGPLQLHSFSTTVVSRDLEDADDLDGHEDEVTANLFYSFLASQSHTLRELELKTEHFCVSPLRIPRLEVLDTLKLDDANSRHIVTLYDGGFAAALPELRHFYYLDSTHSDEGALAAHEVQMAHPGVTGLSVRLRVAKFANFAPLFPSVTSAELYLKAGREETAPLCANIFSAWPALKSLLVDGYLTRLNWDELLTGVPRDWIHGLRKELNKLEVPITPTVLRAAMAKYKVRFGLWDLPHLQNFSLTLRGLQRAKLTDLGGYYGLGLASPNLQQLLIDGKIISEISDECTEFLKRTFGPLTKLRIEPSTSAGDMVEQHGDFMDYMFG